MSMGDKGGPTLWTRRDLLTRTGWGLILASCGAITIAGVRLLWPRVSYAPPTRVILGRPEEFAVGEVSEKWKQSHQLVLVREKLGFYALRSVCTHLGCIPNWKSAVDAFECPCHGSSFHRDGVNFSGPAPRPLERLHIALDEGGQIVVDTAVRFRQERGDWRDANAFLAYSSESDDGAA